MGDEKNITCVVVTALCNQPEAFASDLGDDQSRYLSSIDVYISSFLIFVMVIAVCHTTK